MYRFRHRLPRHTGLLFIMSFLFTLVFSIASPVYPIFMKTFVGLDAYVGLLVALSSVEWIFFTIMMGKILRKIKKVPVTQIALGGFAACYAILPFATSLWHYLLIDLFRSLFAAAATVTFGLFIREVTSKKNLGKTEGYYFTLINIAWLIGPAIGGLLAKFYTFKITFLASAFCAMLAMAVMIIRKPKEKEIDEMETHDHFFSNLKLYFKNRNLTIIYLVSMGLATWWTVLYTYVPLFITEHGFTEAAVGYTITLYTVPLILLNILAGFLADKYGYRRFLSSGFLLMAFVMMFASFTGNVYLLIAAIIAGCFGAAFIEPLHEAYFFKAVSQKVEKKLYPIFRTGLECGYLISPIIFSGVMFITNGSFHALFLMASVMALFFGLLAVFLIKIKKGGVTEIVVETTEERDTY